MNLSYVTPSSPLTHKITGLLLPSCSFCNHRGLGLRSDSYITIEVPLSWGDPETWTMCRQKSPLNPPHALDLFPE